MGLSIQWCEVCKVYFTYNNLMGNMEMQTHLMMHQTRGLNSE